MGCSASKPTTFVTSHIDEPSSSSSSSSSYLDSASLSPLSKQKPRPPIPKTLSLLSPLVHHPPVKKGDTHHLVFLTSTTYGSLLTNPNPNLYFTTSDETPLSKFINFTKTSKNSLTLTDQSEPPSPHSVINTWELMEGLDDVDSSLLDHSIESPEIHNANFYPSCNGSVKDAANSVVAATSTEFVKQSVSKPLWKHLSEESLLSKMDPNVGLSYRLALSTRQSGCNNIKKTRSICSDDSVSSLSNSKDDKIVLYFTSLRGIRRTYEDCCYVRMIFRGFRVPVDERDISMDYAYRKELQSVIGGNKAVTLPQVYISGKHIGGADEIKQLNETGELAQLLVGFPVRDPSTVCKSCGDLRFVPCSNCNGSRKRFNEEDGELRRCLDCNENGLIRCPSCCS